jgi:Na+/melibiose symporter-like transporter
MRRFFLLGIAIPMALTAVASFVLTPLGVLLVALCGSSSSTCLFGYARLSNRSRQAAVTAAWQHGVAAGRRHP